MARRIRVQQLELLPESTPSPEAAAMAEWSGSPKAPPKKRATSWNRPMAQVEMKEFMESRGWEKATPKHLVELYAHLHHQVYGIEALELTQAKIRLAAAGMAARALKTFFDDKIDALVDFMRWTWQRAAREEKERRAGIRQGDFRITWRYQWSPSAITNYQRAIMIAKG